MRITLTFSNYGDAWSLKHQLWRPKVLSIIHQFRANAIANYFHKQLLFFHSLALARIPLYPTTPRALVRQFPISRPVSTTAVRRDTFHQHRHTPLREPVDDAVVATVFVAADLVEPSSKSHAFLHIRARQRQPRVGEQVVS